MNAPAEGKHFSLWAVIVTSAIVGTTVAAGTWQLARAQISDELDQYRRSSEWKLPETLQELGELSKKVSLDVSEQNELIKLRSDINSLGRKIEEAEAKVFSLRAENDHLTQKIADLEGPTVVVEKGLARPVGNRSIIVGVVDTNIYANTAQVQLGAELHKIHVGTPLLAKAGSEQYVITLVKVGQRTCTFTYEKKPNNG